MKSHPALSPPIDLPCAFLADAWRGIQVDPRIKNSLITHALLALDLRKQGVWNPSLPIHGLVVLSGPPGTGKTTLAKGAANEIGRLIGDRRGTPRLVELNPHALTSELLGQTQRSVTAILEQHIPALVEDGPVILLLDEVEALVASRSTTSLETNPVDVHRATNAVLSGLDRLSTECPQLFTIATTNFTTGVDAAFLSRADAVIEVPLPNADAVESILRDTLRALAAHHPNLEPLAAHEGVRQVARALTGSDGRWVRKFVLDALAQDVELALDPGRLTMKQLIAHAKDLKESSK